MHPPDWTRLDTGGAARGQQPPRRVAGVNLGAPKPQPRPPPATEAPSTSSAPADQRLSLSKHFAHAVATSTASAGRAGRAAGGSARRRTPVVSRNAPRPGIELTPSARSVHPAGQGLPHPSRRAGGHPVLLDRAPVPRLQLPSCQKLRTSISGDQHIGSDSKELA
ncbi:hypothetical protein ZWY2020_019341 [Hordeum vulgare]|nr:hypothetical protein ZWY2020_019341 [Hordeum vulgare]